MRAEWVKWNKFIKHKLKQSKGKETSLSNLQTMQLNLLEARLLSFRRSSNSVKVNLNRRIMLNAISKK